MSIFRNIAILPLGALVFFACSDGSEIVRRQLALGDNSSTGSGGDAGSSGEATTTSGAGGAGGAGGDSIVTGSGGSSGTMTTGGGGMMTTGSDGGTPDSGSVVVDPYVGKFKILVLSKTLEFAHDSIATCQTLLSSLGQTPDAQMPQGTKPGSQFTIDIANPNLSQFTDASLKNYAMLFWCNPTGPVFSDPVSGPFPAQMAAIQKFIENGGGWGGVHSATDFENKNGFPWFTNTLLGAYFTTHEGDGTPGTVQVQAQYTNHPVVRNIQKTWSTQDEWYHMSKDINSLPGFQVLAKLAVDQRAVIWVKELGTNNNGRMFYTIRGHNKSVYAEDDFKKLVLNGVLWATHRLQ